MYLCFYGFFFYTICCFAGIIVAGNFTFLKALNKYTTLQMSFVIIV